MATAPKYEIERGLTPPDGGSGRTLKYPFDQMDVGDCFVAEANGNVRGAAYSYGARRGITFTCRTDPDGRVRVWRLT